MWKAVTVVVLGLIVNTWAGLNYGPCHDVTPEEFGVEEWTRFNYLNLMTKNPGLNCAWASRHLVYADGNPNNTNRENVQLSQVFSRMENGTEVKVNLLANYVNGQYQLSTSLGGSTVTIKVTWVRFDLPQLECHYACSDDEYFKNGTGEFICESGYPDALKDNACKIKELAEASGFSVSDLMLVDNCDCPNVPFEYKSNCEKVTVEDYFKDC